MKLFILLFFLIPNIVFSNEINEKYEKVFDLPLSSDSIKNINFLTKPSYILAFMKLNNLYITNHYEVKLINKKSFKIGFGTLNFIKSENNFFFYKVTIEGVGNADVLLAIDNASSKLNVLIEKNSLNILPSDIISRVQRKLLGIASLKVQHELNSLFDLDLNEFASLEEALVINNFNKKELSSIFSFKNNLSTSHKFQLLSIFLIIFILMLFRNRFIKKS